MALKKSISSHIARYSTIKSSNTSLFAFGIVTLLLFSEAFCSLSAGERKASSYASLRAGPRLSRFPAGVERCFSKQRKVSNYYFSHAFLYNKRINVQMVPPDDYKSRNPSFNEKCKVCPMRKGCYKEDAKSKTYSVTIKLDTHAVQEVFQNTEAFKQLAKIATK